MEKRSSIFPREIPPTAGLPLRWGDFFGAPPESLETGIARFIGVPDAQIECSGTASLIVALETFKRRSDRKCVVIPAYTCPLVPLAVRHCGLEIILCDIAPDRFDFDIAALQRTVDRETLCVIATHLAGSIADVSPVIDIANQHSAFVIEDAAQSLGATHRGKSAGTLGDIGFFSLAAGKGLTLYEGGILIAREAGMREALRKMGEEIVPRNRAMEFRRVVELLGYRIFYNPTGLRVTYGANLRRWLTRGHPERAVGDEFDSEIPIHKAGAARKNVGARALPRLREAIVQNRSRAHDRIAALENIPSLTVIRDLPGSNGTWPFIMILFRDEKQCAAALAKLWTAGLGVTKLFVHALNDYDYLKSIVPAASVPNARRFAARHLTISNSPWLSDDEFARILEVIAGCAVA